MEILGGEGERGAEDCQISSKEYDGDIISNVGRYRREGGGGEEEICVGGAWGQLRCDEVKCGESRCIGTVVEEGGH